MNRNTDIRKKSRHRKTMGRADGMMQAETGRMPGYHTGVRVKDFKSPAAARIRFAGVLAGLVILLFAGLANTAEAQFVGFRITVPDEGTRIHPEPLDFSDMERVERTYNEENQLIGLRNASCIEISAPENIPVVVSVSIEDQVRQHNGDRPVHLEPGYINDGDACPEDPALAGQLSVPFPAEQPASFMLNRLPKLTLSMDDPPRRLTGFLYLIGQQHFRPEAPVTEQVRSQRYRGRFFIEIEYL